jgi:hypothetical protein
VYAITNDAATVARGSAQLFLGSGAIRAAPTGAPRPESRRGLKRGDALPGHLTASQLWQAKRSGGSYLFLDDFEA